MARSCIEDTSVVSQPTSVQTVILCKSTMLILLLYVYIYTKFFYICGKLLTIDQEINTIDV